MNEQRPHADSIAENDPLAAALAAYDDALRGTGEEPHESTAENRPAIPAGARACLEFFERAWPRAAVVGAEVAAPAQIGRFEIERVLGQGGFGVVYLARDPRLGRRVALKIPRPHVLASPALHARFLREARAAAALDHANIIPILETGESGPVCYIASAYCEGPTLAEWLKSRTTPIAPAIAARIVARLADAVQYSHDHGILHRDLKPSNVLLAPVSADGERRNGENLPFVPRLTDFGLAKVAHEALDETAASVLMGTPLYMAPELAIGAHEPIGPAADIYALGIILYELLIGRPPFQGLNIVDVVNQAKSDIPVAPRRLRGDVPRDLETICLKCLEKRPDGRYGTAAALADDLGRFVAGRPTLARPLTPAVRGWRWMQRHPERASMIGTLLAALMIVVALSTRYADRLELERVQSRLQGLNLTAARIRERSSNRPTDWQRDNLDELKEIGPQTSDETLRRTLRNEAIRALSAVRLERAAVLLEDFDGFAAAYSPDGRHLAVGCNVAIDGRGVVVLFDAETRQEVRRLYFDPSPKIAKRKVERARTEGVRSLLFAPDGRTLFVGTRGGMIHAWNVETWEMRCAAWQAHHSSVWGLGLLSEHEVLASVSDSADPRLRFWNSQSGKFITQVSYKRGTGETVVTRGNRLFVNVGEELCEYQFDPATKAVKAGWHVPCNGDFLALIPDQRGVVIESGNDLAVLELAQGKTFRRWTDPRRKRLHDGDLHGMDVSRDGRWLLTSASEGLKLWDLPAGEVAAIIPHAGNGRVSAAFRPDNAELAVTRDDRVEVWFWSSAGVWEAAITQTFKIGDMDLSQDGRTLTSVTAAPNRNPSERVALTVDLSRPGSAAPEQLEQATGSIAVSSRGRFLAFELAGEGIGRFDRGTAGTSTLVKPDKQIGTNCQLAFVPNEACFWYSTMQPIDTNARPTEIGTLSAGCLVLVNTSDGTERGRWVNERSAIELRRSEILSLAVGERFAAASSIDGIVRLFDATNGKLLWETALEGRIVDALCLSADEQVVFCGTRQRRFMALSTANGKTLFDIPAHDDALTTVTAATNGLVVTGSGDGILAGWCVVAGVPEGLFRIGPLSGSVKQAVLSRDGSLLAVLIDNETCVRLLHVAELRRHLADLGLDWR